ncbi:MAG: hypothetical protein JWN48_5087, partial [Myxococcaceae bacterium]|nr:hypothetical protein [Myxococcaceae bacterium]
IEMRPDGSAHFLGFDMQRGNRVEWSGDVPACWEWQSTAHFDPTAVHQAVVFIQGKVRTKYLWTPEALEPALADKLPEPRIYDRVEPAAGHAPACQAAWPPAPDLARLDSSAYIHRDKRSLVALLLDARGAAVRFEADARSSHLAWNEQRGCWSRQEGEPGLSITLPQGVVQFEVRGPELIEKPARRPARTFLQAQHF